MTYKVIILKGSVIKIEKWDGNKKLSECGIDSDKAQQLWGNQQPLRAEYEKWVSNGNVPIHEHVTEYFGFEL